MKFFDKWKRCVRKNNSLLCVGLDTELNLIPESLLKEPNPIFDFNRKIVDATCELVCAYKLNSAFYEAYGVKGIETLKQTRDYIPDYIPVILDAKRGDIGNTSKMYAQMAFEEFGVDAITVNPYLGGDGIEPFLKYEDRYIFVLCLTSNPGAVDFQLHGEPPLYLRVAHFVNKWNEKGNCGLVVGATRPEQLKEIRKIAPDSIFLVPGVGAQGGKVEDVIKYGVGTRHGVSLLIINASRSIIYASRGSDFAQKAHESAVAIRNEINSWR